MTPYADRSCARWLGPPDEPGQGRFVNFFCPRCDAENVTEPALVERTKHDELAVAVCLWCRRSVRLRIVSRDFEPWEFGAGVVWPIGWIAVVDDSEDRLDVVWEGGASD